MLLKGIINKLKNQKTTQNTKTLLAPGHLCVLIVQKSEKNSKKIRITLNWLEKWGDFRTIDWINYLEYPEYTLKKISHFLQS